MKKKWNQTGRRFSPLSCRRPPRSVLLQLILLFSLLIPLPACLLSCSKAGGAEVADIVEVPVDSCSICLKFNILDNLADTLHPVRRLDLLVYSADGIQELRHKRYYEHLPDSVILYGPSEAVTVVAVANSPDPLFSNPPLRFDAAEQLQCELSSDSPSHPLMSGTANFNAGEGGTVQVCPLMCKVMLGVITNNLKNYVRLEDPRIYLENVNSGAEILRSGGFRPSELLATTDKVPLPYDIGVFSQSPGTALFCYPNDSAAITIGTPATFLVLECEISGSTRQFKIQLPALRRNSTTRVDISVNGPSEMETAVY